MSNIQSDPADFETLIDLLRWRATAQAEQRAYIYLVDGETDEQSFTNAELDRQARGLAAHLVARGARGERALLLYSPGLDFLKAFFACLYAGVVAVPLYPPRLNRPDHRIQAIANDGQVKFALSTSQTTENLVRRLEHSPDLDRMEWLATDTDFGPLAESWSNPGTRRADLAYLQYTSGSTSTPKGVMVSHGNIVYNLGYIRQTIELSEASKSLTWLPHFHDMGLIDGLLSPIYSGFPGYLMAPNAFLQQPIRWLKAISRYGITHSGGPNFAYDLCVSGTTPEQREGLDLSSWYSAYNGAEPVRVRTLERFIETFKPYGFKPTAMYPVYGLAEATLMVSGGDLTQPYVTLAVEAEALAAHRVAECAPDAPDSQILVGCGFTILKTEVVIAQPDTFTRCTPQEVGEIWLGGPTVTQGYWQRPEETAQMFGASLSDSGEGPFFRTGDLGFMKDGEIYITGRLKDLVIIRGRNHYPQDIELTVEQSHPDLRENSGAAFSVVVAGEERLVIVQEVERTAARTFDEAELFGAIREAVAEEHELQVYAIRLVRPTTVPKTSSGKIQRHACRHSFLAGELNVLAEWTQTLPHPEEAKAVAKEGDGSPGVGEIRQWLREQIALRLGVSAEEIEVQEPFTSYGLDSMELISVSGFLEQWLGRELSPNLMYDYTTIEEVAAYLAEES
jgi:acyl-CoA synthetase (AMP-forming)/AMP-acid ligase II/acyl carrier protein